MISFMPGHHLGFEIGLRGLKCEDCEGDVPIWSREWFEGWGVRFWGLVLLGCSEPDQLPVGCGAVGRGGVGWGNNVHVPVRTQAQQPYHLSCCPAGTGTAHS